MKVFVNLLLIQLAVSDTFLMKDVCHFCDLHMKVPPSFGIVFHEGVARTFLGNDKKCAYVSVFPPLKVVEVAFSQELLIAFYLMVIFLLAEDVLLLEGIALAERLDDIGQHILKEPILVSICTILLHRVFYLKENRRIALLRPQHRVEQFPVLPPDVLQLSKEFIEWFSFLCHS